MFVARCQQHRPRGQPREIVKHIEQVALPEQARHRTDAEQRDPCARAIGSPTTVVDQIAGVGEHREQPRRARLGMAERAGDLGHATFVVYPAEIFEDLERTQFGPYGDVRFRRRPHPASRRFRRDGRICAIDTLHAAIMAAVAPGRQRARKASHAEWLSVLQVISKACTVFQSDFAAPDFGPACLPDRVAERGRQRARRGGFG